MKKYIYFLFIIFFISSCSGEEPVKSFEEYIISDDMESYMKEVGKIHIYYTDRNSKGIYTVNNEIFFSENFTRSFGNLFIADSSVIPTSQTFYILMLLQLSEKTDFDPHKAFPVTIWEGGILTRAESGCVIDIYNKKQEIIKTYIMNGFDVFYEKGKRDVYYKMPKLLLEKFYINEKEIRVAYNEAVRKKR